MTKIFFASDHGGFEFKQILLNHIRSSHPNFEIYDLGPENNSAVDYPDYADKVCQEIIKDKNAKGVLICSSGQGMAMRANKYSGIRAALVWSLESARLSRQHNNANVLCLGGKLLPHDLAIQCFEEFMKSEFEGGRHQTRVDKLSKSC